MPAMRAVGGGGAGAGVFAPKRRWFASQVGLRRIAHVNSRSCRRHGAQESARFALDPSVVAVSMSSTVPDQLLRDILALPADARAAIAAKLLDSLDAEVDADAEAAWLKELERRLQDIDEGHVSTIPWAEVRESILRD